MRMSRKDAAENRQKVLRLASEMFREAGYDGVGIAALMQAAGMTNGAFYKQFDSKEALIAEATSEALDGNAGQWEAALEAAGPEREAALSAWYLSGLHLRHRGRGCAYAALAAEAPRHEPPVQAAFEAGLLRTLRQIAGPEAGPEDEAEAIRLLSRLVGAMVLARAVADPDLAGRILAANGGTPGPEAQGD
ncbi:TetR/AcrR family transcriptional regulator [Poseidonocella sp. HB161398]|uniref:TetR/AcrR family transcriptional regulator n=1 Tax=Poseidonocella sp. HB161398 TaxID=2320855 RepID=UPI001109904B|nr:TetR/AcrR family transcriptional regulator [Poseidonocella sp. HB161398]